MTKSCQAGGKTLELIAEGRIGLRHSRLKEEEKGSRVRSRITLASGGRGGEKIRKGRNTHAALAQCYRGPDQQTPQTGVPKGI